MEIWERKKLDFPPKHRDYNVSRPYALWLEYLKLSPSIALAHKFVNSPQKLTDKEKQQIPQDFDDILKVYDHFAMKDLIDIHVSNVDWWRKYSEYLFGFPGNHEKVRSILEISNNKAIDASIYAEQFTQFVNENLTQQRINNVGHLFLAIPLIGDKTTILQQISDLLPPEKLRSIQKKTNSLYSLNAERIHLEPLKVGLRMIWMKARDPNIAKWKLGVKAGVSEKYSYLNPDSEELPKEEADARRTVGIIANRSFRNALFIMENAARGRFPCTDKIDIPKIDYSEMSIRLKKRLSEERAYDRNQLIQFNIFKNHLKQSGKL